MTPGGPTQVMLLDFGSYAGGTFPNTQGVDNFYVTDNSNIKPLTGFEWGSGITGMWMTFGSTWSPGPVFISDNFAVTPGERIEIDVISTRSSAGTVPTWQGYISYDNNPFVAFTSVITSPVGVAQSYNLPTTVPAGVSQARISFYNLSSGSNGNDMGWRNVTISKSPPDVVTVNYTVLNIDTVEAITSISLTDNTYTVLGGPIASLSPLTNDSTTFSGTINTTGPPYPYHQVILSGTTVGYGAVNSVFVRQTTGI